MLSKKVNIVFFKDYRGVENELSHIVSINRINS